MAQPSETSTAGSSRDVAEPRHAWRLSGPREIFAIDLRTLALFRVGLALVVLANLVLRARDLRAHYTDFGIFPRAELAAYLHPGAFSLHMLNGTVWYQALLFTIAVLFALSLLVGYRARLSMFVTWLLLLSLQNRNPQILSGEDNLLMLLAFWAMFLPIGARYAVDAALDRDNEVRPNRYVSIASAALLIQGMSMYFFSAILKSDPRWCPDGTAVYYALNLDYIVSSLSLWFRQFDGVMQFLTYYVWTLEWVGPVLIFFPLFHRPLRVLVQAAFITMHVGFSLFLMIGFFPWISIVMNLAFTQGWVWDRLAALTRRRQAEGMVIHYDAECDFCLKVCLLLKTFLMLAGVPVVTVQSEARIHALMQAHNSWVVRDGAGRDRVRWDAIRAVFEASPAFFWLAPVIAPRGCGDCVYEAVAKSRGRLSRLSARLLVFRPIGIRPGLVTSALAVVLSCFVLVQNLSTVPALDIRTTDSFRAIRQALGLYQNWTMFAPYPEVTSAWPVIPGVLVDGTEVDVYRGTVGAPSFNRPARIAAVYENERWRKYISNVEDLSYDSDRPDFALNWGRYLCRQWNEGAAPDRSLATFDIYFQVERTMPPGQPKELATRPVWRHDCLN